MLEQSAEARVATDLVDGNDRPRLLVLFRADQPVANSLMWPAVVVVRYKFRDDVVEVGETENDELNYYRLKPVG